MDLLEMQQGSFKIFETPKEQFLGFRFSQLLHTSYDFIYECFPTYIFTYLLKSHPQAMPRYCNPARRGFALDQIGALNCSTQFAFVSDFMPSFTKLFRYVTGFCCTIIQNCIRLYALVCQIVQKCNWILRQYQSL